MKRGAERDSFFVRLANLLIRFFGKLSYEAPAWTRRTKSPAAATTEGGAVAEAGIGQSDVRSATPRKSAFVRFFGDFFRFGKNRVGVRIAKIAGLLAVAGAIALLVAYLATDRSDWVSFEVHAPAPTALEPGAQINPLELDFSASAARIELAGKVVPDGITIDPPVKGQWTWNGDDSLLFEAQEDWVSARKYTVSLAPKIFREGLHLYQNGFDFTMPSFSGDLSDLYFQIDPRDDKDRRVMGTIALNYPVDPTSVKGQIELRVLDNKQIDGKSSIPVDLSYDDFHGKIYVKSDRLPVPKDSVSLELVVHQGLKTSSGSSGLAAELRKNVGVPGIYDRVAYGEPELSVVRNDNYEYQQIFTLPLSGEVDPERIGGTLRMWVLPKDRVGVPGMEDEKDHEWSRAEVDRALLSKSEPLQPQRVPSENDTAHVVSFVYEAPAGRSVYAELAGNVPAYGGYIIKDPLKFTGIVPEVPKALDIMHEGSIMSLTGDKTLSIVSNDIRTVRFQLNRLFPDQVNHFVTQTSGPFSLPQFRDPSLFSALDMSVVYEETRELAQLPPGRVQYYSFDFSKYLGRSSNPNETHGLFMLKVAEYNRETKSETGVASRRFVLVTDLGLLAKRATDQSYDVYVENIRSATPQAGASVRVLGRNGVPIFEAQSDENGHVHVPSLRAYLLEKQAVAFTADTGNDFSFLPVDSEDRFLDFSRFDIGGITGASDPQKLSSFVFSDRGLYRPGDVINAGYIVRAGDWGRSLAGLPLELSVLDPRGIAVWKKLVKLSPEGFDEANYQTVDTAPTGNYEFDVSLVKPDKSRELLGSTRARVEEFQPDRLTISTRIEGAADKAWIPFASVKASMRLMNLYGLPASGNPVKAGFSLSPKHMSFASFPDYTFYDAWASDKYYDENLPASTTDDQGNAVFSMDLSKFEPATFQLTLNVEGQEKQGGRSVSAQSSVIVSPLDSVIGWKADGNLDYINKSAARSVRFIAIDPDQNPVGVRGLRLAIDELRYMSVLMKQDDGSYRYQSVQKKFRIRDGAFAVDAQGTQVPLDSSSPGDFELTISDSNARVLSRVDWTIVGAGNLARTLDRNAELEIKLDRDSYAVGDNIELQIKAPYAGSGLITIERDKVYASQWFSSAESASIQHIRVPEGLEGNAYVNVSFVRGLDSPEIYMSPLSYGVVPFKVSLGKRDITVNLASDDEVKPGKPYAIRYRTDRPSKIVVFAVDEGILQLARYATPQPNSFFFQKRALELQTSQILDLILPEFNIVQQLAATGGDEGALGKRLNPFKRKNQVPVAYWSGVLDAGPDERTVRYTVPSYFNGTLRVMAVAVSHDAIGAADKRAIIRDDFIITPTVPTQLAPGDQFDLGVTVANNAKTKAATPQIEVKLGVDSGLSVVGDSRKSISLARNTEGTVWFKVKAGDKPGAPEIHLSASAESLTSVADESLSIRPAEAYRESISSGVLNGPATSVQTPRVLYPDFRKLAVSASYKPAALTVGLLSYLRDFPYGCSEQLVSQTFPLVVLQDDPSSGVDRKRAEDAFANTLRALQARQNDDGSIGLWSANGEPDAFVSIYTAQFLTEAQARGFSSPEEMRKALAQWMRSFIDESISDKTNLDLAAYASWVLNMNGVVTGSALADIRHALDEKGGDWKKTTTALFLAGSYALLKQQKEADSLLAGFGTGTRKEASSYWDSELYDLSLLVIMNSRYRSGTAFGAAGQALDRMVKILSDSGYSTVSSALAILAFRAYGDRAPPVSASNLEIVQTLRDGTTQKLTIVPGNVAELAYSDQAVSLAINNKAGLPLYWQVVQSGFDTQLPSKASLSGLEIYREYQDEKGQVVSRATRGQELTAVIKVRSSNGKTVENVAITDLLPGGFEVSLDQSSNGTFSETVGGNFAREFTQAREDRVIVIGSVSGTLTDFRYKIKATNSGTFTVPGTSAEAMYDLKTRAESAASTITVGQ